MNAWIITWEWIGGHAAVSDPLVAIFSSRKSEKWIKEYIENFYLFKFYQIADWAYYAKDRKRKELIDTAKIHHPPDGNGITCGESPWLYGRIVSDLKIETNNENNCEIISWREPPIYQWKDKNHDDIEFLKEGKKRTIERKERNPYKELKVLNNNS